MRTFFTLGIFLFLLCPVFSQVDTVGLTPMPNPRAHQRLTYHTGYYPGQGSRSTTLLDLDFWFTDSLAMGLGLRIGYGTLQQWNLRTFDKRGSFTLGMYLMTGRNSTHFDIMFGLYAYQDQKPYTRPVLPQVEIGLWHQKRAGGPILRVHAGSATGFGLGVGWAVKPL